MTAPRRLPERAPDLAASAVDGLAALEQPADRLEISGLDRDEQHLGAGRLAAGATLRRVGSACDQEGDELVIAPRGRDLRRGQSAFVARRLALPPPAASAPVP